MAKKPKTRTYTVSEVNTLARVALEQGLPSRMIIAGEISDWKHHYSGHCYFSLKDEGSQIPCVMWASKYKKAKFTPENGMAVLATGHVEVYVPQGKYQFYADKLEPAGVGALQLAFEQMVKRLRSEGLFEDDHKKTIPAYPMRIGIITSESGAAVLDIADSVYNRWPCAKLFLYPAPVQGEGAAEKIAAAIKAVNGRNKQLKLDVLIVGRGGGSLEDLWAFNEEPVARAIYDSVIPVISAVGHEVDVTIADLVADARASTPTKAGMIAVPDMNEVLERIDQAGQRLMLEMRSRLGLCGQRLATIEASAMFRNPQWLVNNASQMVDDRAMRLAGAAKGMFAQLRDGLDKAQQQIMRIEPHRLVGHKRIELHGLAGRVRAAVKDVFAKKELQLTAAANRLEALDPRSVLNRGYSITTNLKSGEVVTSAADVEVGDLVRTEVAKQGVIESEVKKVERRSK
jgi:exodeoxyribonuclease VII large subunit